MVSMVSFRSASALFLVLPVVVFGGENSGPARQSSVIGDDDLGSATSMETDSGISDPTPVLVYYFDIKLARWK